MKAQIILSSVILFINSTLCEALIFVDKNAIGQNNGKNWHDAYQNLDTALTYSQPDDTIWVAQGIYKPGNGSNRAATFLMHNLKNIKLFGGFAGIEKNLNQRNYVSNETILCGDIGKIGESSDNCYSVVDISGYSTLLDGFIVQNGNGSGDNRYGAMGGALRLSKYPTIKNCIFYNNYSKCGGAIGYEGYGCPVFENCKFISNTAKYGGAVYQTNATHSSPPVYIGCLFHNNYAEIGGAIYLWKGNFKGINCTFVNNSNCLYAYDYNSLCTLEFVNSIFYNNGNSDVFESIFVCSGTINKRSMTYCLFPQDTKLPMDNIYKAFNVHGTPSFENTLGLDMKSGSIDDNFQLASNSLGINLGLNSLTDSNLPEYDYYGNKRIFDTTIDIGAFELNYIATNCTPLKESVIKITPNLITDEVIKIDLGRTYKDISIKIVNIYGITIQSYAYSNIKYIEDRITAKNGIYFVQIFEADKLLTSQKILKNKY